MSRDDYRPAEWQIRQVARCNQCSRESEYDSQQSLSGARCYCGGELIVIGESYPADSRDWEEQRDPDGEWRERRW